MTKRFFLWLALATTPAYAGKVITQEIDSSINKEQFKSRHTWSIDRGKFRLDISTSQGKTQYIFNGRNFYICSKLTNSQISYLSQNNISSSDVVAKYKNGACQTVPSNFLARFFLSPSAAVDTIDQMDGLKLTLSLQDYRLKVAGKENMNNMECKKFTRAYTLTRSATASSGQSHKSAAEEEFCQTADISWRKSVWREVAKVVMRQTKGAKFMASLRRDHTRLQGFTLWSKSTITTTDRSGKLHKGTHTLKTLAISEKKFNRKTFRLPSGYELFSPDSIVLAMGNAATVKKKDASEDEADRGTIVESVTSAFFCAIAGGLACFDF